MGNGLDSWRRFFFVFLDMYDARLVMAAANVDKNTKRVAQAVQSDENRHAK